MSLKGFLLQILDRFLASNPGFVFTFLDNAPGRKLFLKEYLKNRPQQFFSYYHWKPVRGKTKNILILKTDAIGDYLLFRNFLEEISRRYRPEGYRIFLAGNSLWKDLALELDGQWLDGSYWLDRRGLNAKPGESQQIEFLQAVNSQSYDKLLYPNFSREWEAGDFLSARIPAREKWAFSGNCVNETVSQWEEGNSYYSHLQKPAAGVAFEFYRNREIVSAFLRQESALEKPELSGISPERPIAEPYAVIFPGASHVSKRWPSRHFAEIVAFLQANTDFKLLIAGSFAETDLCAEVAAAAPEQSLSLAGKTSIYGLLRIIAGAELLISNDTAALHMGVQCGINTLAIWKGNHYGRFLPYPEAHFPNLKICLPAGLQKMERHELEAAYAENYGADIGEIPSESLIGFLPGMLKK